MAKLNISAKCSDLCFAEFAGIEHDGYVPNIKGIGGGDYVDIQIDNETGKVIGWEPLTVESFKKACSNI